MAYTPGFEYDLFISYPTEAIKQVRNSVENCLTFKTSKQFSSDTTTDTGIKFQAR